MTCRSLHRALAQALAAVYLVVVSGPAVALVYCVDRDGHQGIESALAQDCCAKPPQENSNEVSCAAHSCDCTDTPLVVKATLQNKSSVNAPRATTQLVPLPPLLSVIPSEQFAVAETALVDPSGGLFALRSVILLI